MLIISPTARVSYRAPRKSLR